MVPPAARATSSRVPPRCPAAPCPPADPAAIAVAATSAAATAVPVTRLMLPSFAPGSVSPTPFAPALEPGQDGGRGDPARLGRDASEPGQRIQEERRRSGAAAWPR